MKKIVSALAALALVAPSVASAAAPAASSSTKAAKALSVKAAAVKPLRANGDGEGSGGISPGLIVIITGLVGGIALALGGGGDSR